MNAYIAAAVISIQNSYDASGTFDQSPLFMNLASHYQLNLTQTGFSLDAAQAEALAEFEQLRQRLAGAPGHSAWQRVARWLGLPGRSVSGIYLWGGVGRGKTWLMDLFYEQLPLKQKMRLHFLHFMQTVHDQLSLLKGQRDPLKLIARNLAHSTRVLCLDEFHVDDITNAMLLRGLLEALFREGVTLVATSNQAPDDLYKHGLQREQFVPAINLIKTHTRVLRMDGGIDHRLRLLEKADVWYSPISPETTRQLQNRFAELAPRQDFRPETLLINYREIHSELCADDIVWFDFNILCNNPRATPDYIEIARRFHTVFLSGIPQLGEALDDRALRFIHLIDEFYDRNVKLIASAACQPGELYTGQQLVFEFRRTHSRLEEMRSHDYLARPHKC